MLNESSPDPSMVKMIATTSTSRVEDNGVVIIVEHTESVEFDSKIASGLDNANSATMYVAKKLL